MKLSFAGKCMGLEIIMLSKICQIKKEKYHMFSHMCGIYTFFKDIKLEGGAI
jgi:hypothetical protein